MADFGIDPPAYLDPRMTIMPVAGTTPQSINSPGFAPGEGQYMPNSPTNPDSPFYQPSGGAKPGTAEWWTNYIANQPENVNLQVWDQNRQLTDPTQIQSFLTQNPWVMEQMSQDPYGKYALDPTGYLANLDAREYRPDPISGEMVPVIPGQYNWDPREYNAGTGPQQSAIFGNYTPAEGRESRYFGHSPTIGRQLQGAGQMYGDILTGRTGEGTVYGEDMSPSERLMQAVGLYITGAGAGSLLGGAEAGAAAGETGAGESFGLTGMEGGEGASMDFFGSGAGEDFGLTGDEWFGGETGASEDFGLTGNEGGGFDTGSGEDFGLTGNEGGTSSSTNWLDRLRQASPLVRNLLGGGGAGGRTGGIGGIGAGIMNDPLLAALLAAGLFEKDKNPLTQPMIDAVKGAIQSGQTIQGMSAPGITPSMQRAIDVAGTNVGAWKPYVDEAGAFTRSGGAPISSEDIARLFNPYVEQALNPAARKVSEAAALQRQADKARSMGRGSFGGDRQALFEGLNERNELTALADLYGQGYGRAFDTALSGAGADKARALSAGGAFGNLGSTVSALGGQDVAGLTGAGSLETQPFVQNLLKEKTAADAFAGAAGAAAKAHPSTAQPSLLSNITGALGILGSTGGQSGGGGGGGQGMQTGGGDFAQLNFLTPSTGASEPVTGYGNRSA